MGQRLNIEITKNGNVLANSYYHWSAYSDCALNITTKIITLKNYFVLYMPFYLHLYFFLEELYKLSVNNMFNFIHIIK